MAEQEKQSTERRPAKPGEDTSLLATPSQVAELLQVSTRTLWRMRREQKLPEPIRLGAAVRWRRDEINQWVKEGCPSHARRIDGFRSR